MSTKAKRSKNIQRCMIAALAVMMLSLMGLTALQVSADSELVVAATTTEAMIGPGDICNNIFIACGGFLACPGGCYCATLGSGSGICLQ